MNFDAEAIADIALKLEEMGKREDLTGVSALVSELDTEVHRLQDHSSKIGI